MIYPTCSDIRHYTSTTCCYATKTSEIRLNLLVQQKQQEYQTLSGQGDFKRFTSALRTDWRTQGEVLWKFLTGVCHIFRFQSQPASENVAKKDTLLKNFRPIMTLCVPWIRGSPTKKAKQREEREPLVTFGEAFQVIRPIKLSHSASGKQHWNVPVVLMMKNIWME